MTSISAWDEPAGITARGTLVLLPGRGEQPELYRRFGSRIAADGYRVRALPDPTGDLEAVTAQLKAVLTGPDTTAPRIVVGVDTGALAALRVAATSSVPVDALILVGLPGSEHAVDGEPASWDEESQARASCPTHRGLIENEALVERGALTAQRIPQALRENVHLPALTLPVLGLHGDNDTISPIEGVLATYAQLPDARLVRVGDGRHDALNAAQHRSVAARVVQFLEALRTDPGAPPILHEVDL
jgi:alpha-beta hydrolase superfamily lysophospholipase